MDCTCLHHSAWVAVVCRPPTVESNSNPQLQNGWGRRVCDARECDVRESSRTAQLSCGWPRGAKGRQSFSPHLFRSVASRRAERSEWLNLSVTHIIFSDTVRAFPGNCSCFGPRALCQPQHRLIWRLTVTLWGDSSWLVARSVFPAISPTKCGFAARPLFSNVPPTNKSRCISLSQRWRVFCVLLPWPEPTGDSRRLGFSSAG